MDEVIREFRELVAERPPTTGSDLRRLWREAWQIVMLREIVVM